ncbi:MAG: LytTR family DNA-binding domain-containing protein [Acetatifactor sp.]|nr:LytTR family DNA-binding domain-containing protein [Acetatifactor sp.]
MIMKIAVCDDCMVDALSLKRFLGGHEVKVYYDADSLLADVEENKMQYDLYLLDIFIEESINGIRLAEKIRGTQEEAVICFISSSDDFYREAYDLYAVQYLLKPVQEEAVKKLLDKVSKNLVRDREQKLSFQSRGQTGSISYGKILYISSMEHTISIYCTDGTVHECKGKLNELATRVCGNIFMRCHQSFLVNMYHVDSINGMELTVAGARIPISRRYCAEVKERYQEILFEEMG